MNPINNKDCRSGDQLVDNRVKKREIAVEPGQYLRKPSAVIFNDDEITNIDTNELLSNSIVNQRLDGLKVLVG